MTIEQMRERKQELDILTGRSRIFPEFRSEQCRKYSAV